MLRVTYPEEAERPWRAAPEAASPQGLFVLSWFHAAFWVRGTFSPEAVILT